MLLLATIRYVHMWFHAQLAHKILNGIHSRPTVGNINLFSNFKHLYFDPFHSSLSVCGKWFSVCPSFKFWNTTGTDYLESFAVVSSVMTSSLRVEVKFRNTSQKTEFPFENMKVKVVWINSNSLNQDQDDLLLTLSNFGPNKEMFKEKKKPIHLVQLIWTTSNTNFEFLQRIFCLFNFWIYFTR